MKKLNRRDLVVGLAAVSLTVPTLSSVRASAQGSIPDGVFVRESNGPVWLVLRGQRVAVAMWPTTDADIAALPQSDLWAVLSVNDAGAIVGGGKPAWYVESTAPTAATTPSTPVAAVPAAKPTSSGQLVVTTTATWTEKMFGSTYVVGMVENQSSSDLALKIIAVSLLGPNGETVGSASALDKPSMLTAGARGPWRSLVSGTPVFSNVRMQLESGPIDNRFVGEISQDLRADGVTTQVRQRSANPKILGQIVNTAGKTLGTAKVIGAVFSSDGQLLDVDAGYGKLENMTPGQSAPFELTFISPAVQDPSRYELYFEARAKS